MNQVWVGIKGILGKLAGEAYTGITTLRAQTVKRPVDPRGGGKYQYSITAS